MISWKVTLWLTDSEPWKRGPDNIAATFNALELPDSMELNSIAVKPMRPTEAGQRADPPSDVWALFCYISRLLMASIATTATAAFLLPRFGIAAIVVAIIANCWMVYCDKVTQRRDEFQGRLDA